MQVPSGFVFHQANSYYDPDKTCMVVVCVRMSKFPEFDKQAGQADRPFVVSLKMPSRAGQGFVMHAYTMPGMEGRVERGG